MHRLRGNCMLRHMHILRSHHLLYRQDKYYGASRSKLEELVEEAGAECKIGKAVWIDRSILEDFMRAHNTRRGIGRY